MRCAMAMAVLVRRLSRSIFSHVGAVLLKCASQSEIAKTIEPPIFGVQNHLRSSMLTPLKSSSLVLVMISSMSVSMCNCFHAK